MNEKQLELIQIIIRIISSWENTNDVSSPTLVSDIKEELDKFEYFNTKEDKQRLYIQLRSILATIKFKVDE